MSVYIRQALMVSMWLSFLAVVLASATGIKPQIPSVESFEAGEGSFELLPTVRIIVDSEHGTLGSPSAYSFAQTFHSDLKSVASFPALPPVEFGRAEPGTIFLPVINIVVDPSLKYALFNGNPTDEGYEFEITEFTYTIKAAAPVGAWWGSRTLLQQAALQLAAGTKIVRFPVGSGSDVPGWEIRGFMLDAGRHWFPTSFLSKSYEQASDFWHLR